MSKRIRTLLLSLVCLTLNSAVARSSEDFLIFPETLMQSTFKLEANGTLGTGFILGHWLSTKQGYARFILVTANHVLEGFKADFATIHFRKKLGSTFAPLPYQMGIRKNGTPLWKASSDVDVAVLEIGIPDEANIRSIDVVNTSFLATDEDLVHFRVRPGDELLVLGYPHGAVGSVGGFPVLRSGRIASYPIVPTSVTMSFLLDFEVFPGNSGGPVFLSEGFRRLTNGQGQARFLAGIVTQQMSYLHKDQAQVTQDRLALAVVVHASHIRNLIERLFPEDPIRRGGRDDE